MTKKLSIVLSLLVFTALPGFLAIQIYVMSWENSSLPKMENPKIVIRKKGRKLELTDGGKLIKTYTIALGSTPVGDKESEGDGKTPEGEFYIFTKNDKSKFHLSLGISYPSIDDAGHGLAQKIISQEEHDAILEAIENKQMPLQKTRLGGEIYIHGGGTIADWTDGCIALKNEEIKELFDVVSVGTSVRIEP